MCVSSGQTITCCAQVAFTVDCEVGLRLWPLVGFSAFFQPSKLISSCRDIRTGIGFAIGSDRPTWITGRALYEPSSVHSNASISNGTDSEMRVRERLSLPTWRLSYSTPPTSVRSFAFFRSTDFVCIEVEDTTL